MNLRTVSVLNPLQISVSKHRYKVDANRYSWPVQWTLLLADRRSHSRLCMFDVYLQNHVYWPVDKGHSIAHGQFTITLQSSKNMNTWIERILSVYNKAVSFTFY